MSTFDVGSKGVATLRVAPEHSAEALGSGELPVFSTPILVALMEQAAVNAIRDRLDPDQTTVGTRIEVAHLAATPLGMEVRAEATLIEVDGRTLTFSIEAHDAREKIGEGRHRRAVISRDRFMARVEAKR